MHSQNNLQWRSNSPGKSVRTPIRKARGRSCKSKIDASDFYNSIEMYFSDLKMHFQIQEAVDPIEFLHTCALKCRNITTRSRDRICHSFDFEV